MTLTPFKIEEAKSANGDVIGWRLFFATKEDCYLIWKDQGILPGLRYDSDGKGFVPKIGENIEYTELGLVPKKHHYPTVEFEDNPNA